MKKNYASILITNYNKEKYIKHTINSCLKQNFKKKEILVFDDFSSDGSLKILKSYNKKIKLIKNKKKKFRNAPLNQIYGLVKLFNKSKGEIIFLLDGDDTFKKNKLSFISNLFLKNKNLEFIQDTPFLTNSNKLMYLEPKKHHYSIWPRFHPTSCIAFKRKFFLNFLKFLEKNKYPNLEIDARLSIFAFQKNKFFIIKKSLTNYNYDKSGISSRYNKFSISWWKKRNEAFDYLMILNRKLKIKFYYSIDYFLTKLINFFIKFNNHIFNKYF